LILSLTIFSPFFLFSPLNLCEAHSIPQQNLEPEWLGTKLEYYTDNIAINFIDGPDLGPNFQCYISYNFWNNESGNYIENEISIHDQQNIQQFIETQIFLINYSTLELSFLNGTNYGKTHLFMDTSGLIINQQRVVVSTYNENIITGTVHYDPNDVIYVCDNQLVDYSEIRSKIEEIEGNPEYSLLYEKETGILVYFIPVFFTLDIFQLFDIRYASGPPFQLIYSDFEFPYLDSEKLDHEKLDPEINNANFDFSSLLSIGLIVGIFSSIYYSVSKNRNPKRKSINKKKTKFRK
jgi:hypothetical protein